MEQRFSAVLDNILGPERTTHCILALSGGIDSVVMAYLFKSTNYPFSIAHCNFQLRGNQSDEDEEFVKRLADSLDVEIVTKRFETAEYARQHRISIQMAARDLRYDWFKSLAKVKQAKVALAHHANDVVETMLFNLSKGTGIAGLHGIAEYDGFVIRPLLWSKKGEIATYAVNNKIDWREDRSNESEKYMRNIIRLKVIPEIERINPSFIEAGVRTAARLKSAEDFMQYAVDKLNLVDIKGEEIYIRTDLIEGIPGREAILYQLIKPYGFSYNQIQSIEKSIGNSGAIFNATEWILNIDRENLILSKENTHRIEIRISEVDTIVDLGATKLKIETATQEDFKLIRSSKNAALDYDKLSFPLLLRNWQQGDQFVPLGMEGNKKISDLLIDEKIPVVAKAKTLVLLSGSEIVWVVGLRISEHFKITPKTRRFYHIKQY